MAHQVKGANGLPAQPSLATGGSTSATAAGDSSAPLLDAAGRYLFFLSTAGNLVTNGASSGGQQVYLRDLILGRLTCLSLSTNQVLGNGPSSQISISADARMVAFVSEASNLVAGDTNGLADVFVQDLTTGATRIVSRAPDGSSADGPSSSPVLTADRHYVFFVSAASNLTAAKDNTNRVTQIYRADLNTGELLLVSPPLAQGAFRSDWPLPSDDGSRIVFWSSRVQNPTNYVLFAQPPSPSYTAINDLVPSLFSVSVIPNLDLSADGTVALITTASAQRNATNASLYRVALPSGPAQLIAPNLNTTLPAQRGGRARAILSPDGRTVFFEATQTTNGPEAVYVWDSASQSATLLSANEVTMAGQAEPQPFGILAGASADAQYVAWLAYPTNGVAYGSNAPLELFVKNRTTGEIRQVTHGLNVDSETTSTDLPAVSFCADGTLLAFSSSAPDLVANDINAASDIFLYHWGSDSLELISKPASTLALSTALGLSAAGANSFTADGRFLVYTSSSEGLTSIATRGVPNVYLRDLITGSNQLVSISVDGAAAANGTCRQASISADGQWIVFSSLASNLVSGDTNHLEDVFLRDMAQGKTFLVSRPELLSKPSLASQNPVISDDGTRVAFTSSVTGYERASRDVYVYDRVSGKIQLLSAEAGGLPVTSQLPVGPAFSPDGTTLVYSDSAAPAIAAWHVGDTKPSFILTNASAWTKHLAFSSDSRKVLLTLRQSITSHLVFYDFTRNQATDLGSGLTGGALNRDGTLVACLSTDPSANGQVMLIDLNQGSTNLVSTALGRSGPGNGRSFLPLLTPDGRFVIFASQATDLVPSDSNSAADLFVRDLQSNSTLALSQSPLGALLGDANSGHPILGRDGRTVLFSSFASNLAADDFNQLSDLFIARLPGQESDFRILSIGRLSTGDITLIWAAQPGASYQLQYIDGINGTWQVLNTPVQLQGNQATATDTTAAGRFARFYRVVNLSP